MSPTRLPENCCRKRVFLLGGELKEVTEAIVGAEAIDSLKRYFFRG